MLVTAPKMRVMLSAQTKLPVKSHAFLDSIRRPRGGAADTSKLPRSRGDRKTLGYRDHIWLFTYLAVVMVPYILAMRCMSWLLS